VAYGRNGKGLLIHRLTEAAGMPLAHRTTPANGPERAQVRPRLAAVHLRTGRRGRPRTRPQVSATAQGDEATDLRRQRRTRGIRAQIPKRLGKTEQPRGRPVKIAVPRVQAERTCAWFQQQYRRLVVRWERLAAGFAAFLASATIHSWMPRFIVDKFMVWRQSSSLVQ
jgi:hypothetical protein